MQQPFTVDIDDDLLALALAQATAARQRITLYQAVSHRMRLGAQAAARPPHPTLYEDPTP
ncbi:hypothetical protein EII20_06730 [Comamonadaceae bacterium OH2545_COT-014]|nr:hypothetical protein EII20_06730 [Comamonadaceae bacterium OH2545_COT-014]